MIDAKIHTITTIDMVKARRTKEAAETINGGPPGLRPVNAHQSEVHRPAALALPGGGQMSEIVTVAAGAATGAATGATTGATTGAASRAAREARAAMGEALVAKAARGAAMAARAAVAARVAPMPKLPPGKTMGVRPLHALQRGLRPVRERAMVVSLITAISKTTSRIAAWTWTPVCNTAMLTIHFVQ